MKKIFIFVILINISIAAVCHPQSVDVILSEKNFKTGITRFYNREYEAAIQLFTKSLSFQPMNFKSRYYLGLAYLNSGYAKNALTEWESLIKLGGGNYQVKQKLNDLYFRLSIDKSYDYSTPYMFSKYFDGIENGMHKIIRPSFILYDPQYDSVIVSSVKTKYVVEIDGSGHIIRQFGRQFGDFSSFITPTGICLNGSKLYVSDFTADSVYVFTRDGKYLYRIGAGKSSTNTASLLTFFSSAFNTIKNPSVLFKKTETEHGISNLAGPLGLAVSSDEYLFVINNGNDRIQKFDLNGNWIQSIAEGELNRPTDIEIQDNILYVSDTYNKRIVTFDTFGNMLETIGEGQLEEPRGLFLKDNKLYITDSRKGLYIYNITNKSFEKFTLDEGKMKFPFDVCLDRKNILYETDFNTQNIAIYNPLQLQYANLGVQISQIWTSSYPDNLLHLRVWDKTGAPVYNLKEDNIRIFEEGTEIPLLRLGTTFNFRKNMYVKLIVDKSIPMKQYEPELTESLNAFLQKSTGSDWLDLIVVNTAMESSGKILSSTLWPVDYINKISYNNPFPGELDKAFHKSITELLNINRNKAILLLTAGEIGNTTFDDYDPDMLVTFARQNAVPIYIVNFTDKNRDIFQRISEETFGKYYNLKNIKEIMNLYNEIKNAPPLEYIISYNGLNLKGLRNYWVNVHVKADYKDFIGVDDIGYYVPEIISKQSLFNFGKEKNSIEIPKQ